MYATSCASAALVGGTVNPCRDDQHQVAVALLQLLQRVLAAPLRDLEGRVCSSTSTSAALSALFASSTTPSATWVVPPKLRTPKISMMTSGTTSEKKSALRLRMNILKLATKRARKTPNFIRLLVLPQVVPGQVDEDVLEVGRPLDPLLGEAAADQRIDQGVRVSRAMILPPSMTATRWQSSSASSM